MEMSMGLGLAKLCTPKKSGSSFAKLLLHLDSDFSDSSILNNPPTLIGGAVTIDTTRAVFGAGSLKGVSNGRVQYPGSDDWKIRSGTPFQVSWRMWLNNFNTEYWFLGNQSSSGSTGFFFIIKSSGTVFRIRIQGFNNNISHNFATGQWNAYRVNHDGAGNYRFFVDGILIDTIVISSGSDASTPLNIGASYSNTSGLSGNLDEILWEQGSNLIITTANYTVETTVFPDP
mgnify:CR=1 FL=1